MKKLILILIVISPISCVMGQDIHFTQTSNTPLLINPAAAGVYDGWERVVINQRNQWLGAGTQFMTTSVAADANFFKDEIKRKAHLGVGLLFYNDIGGDSRFGTQSALLTLSGILPVGKAGTLSTGIQGGYGSKSMNVNNLTFSSQWNGVNFDKSILSGEGNVASFQYMDASAGMYYVYDGGKSSFKRNEDFKFQIGFSGYHLNRPEMKFTTVTGDRMYSKWVGHAGIVSDIFNSDLAIDASVVQVFQGPHSETILGTILKYRFANGTKYTGHYQDAYVGFGAYYRLKDAIAPSIMIDWKGFRFGMSYDVTVSQLRKAYSGGSLEFSLSYTNLKTALFKGRNNRF
jgi:type IX secretion system PorP/SprF family membrane protein